MTVRSLPVTVLPFGGGLAKADSTTNMVGSGVVPLEQSPEGDLCL